MRRIIVASHGLMAKGIQSTLELFAGTERPVTYMSAYVDGEPSIDQQITDYFQAVASEDQVIIFTDLFGGSVNQKLMLAANKRPHTVLVAGFNLPLLIEVAVGDDNLIETELAQLIAESRQALQQVPLMNQTQPLEEQISAEEKDTHPRTQTDGDKLQAMLRVDERLIHGQIAMVWSRALNLDGIIVANDEVATNEAQQMALKMAVPSGVKVLIRPVADIIAVLHDPRAKKKRLLVLVRTVQDALRLCEKVATFSAINIGNVGKSVPGDKRTLTQFVMLTEDEYQALKQVVSYYPDTMLQNVPADKKIPARAKIKE